MPLVYLDTCALQRPLDDREQARVRIEADAVTEVIGAVEAGRVDLTTSSALRLEVSRGPDRSRRDFADRVRFLATRDVGTSDETDALAVELEQAGVHPLDALHVALAIAAGADFFCTTDDRLLRRARATNTRAVRVVDPLELLAALVP